MYKKYEKYYNVISSKKKNHLILSFRILEGKKRRVMGERAREKIVDSKLGRGGEEGEFSSSNEIQNFGCSRQESDAAE